MTASFDAQAPGFPADFEKLKNKDALKTAAGYAPKERSQPQVQLTDFKHNRELREKEFACESVSVQRVFRSSAPNRPMEIGRAQEGSAQDERGKTTVLEASA